MTMKRRELLQGGLAGLAGLLIARTAGAQQLPPLEDRPTRYYAAVARTCNRSFDAVYSLVVAHPRPAGVTVEQRARDICNDAQAGVEHAMERCRTGRCPIIRPDEGCDWGALRTNSFLYPSDQPGHERYGSELQAEGRGIVIYSLTRESYEALDTYIQNLQGLCHEITSQRLARRSRTRPAPTEGAVAYPWYFVAEHGVQVTRDINLFRR